MPLNMAQARECLKQFDLRKLFVRELGWDNLKEEPAIKVDGYTGKLKPVAHKRSFAVFEVPAPAGQPLPDSTVRKRIERQVEKLHHEHLLIFTDAARTTQVWHWAKREAGKLVASREHPWTTAQQGDALLQKLDRLAVAIDEEEALTLTRVGGKVAGAFDVDRVTKKFYDRFKAEHQAFLGFIKGIKAQGDAAWYASLMLNRLMFVYFIQRKGFLDGDPHYLRSKLRQMQLMRGKDKFLSFYRHFLLRLFHEGLGSDERSAELDALLGTVPFLNGGLFDMHQLEAGEAGAAIAIKDEAFEKLFDFFDAYQWHLDERPLRADNEINPDVLGYIFEKYINQKQMGAYYTKEDITEYIGKNTIVPWLLDAAEKKCTIAFRPDGALWRLLRDNPDRYLYPAVRNGVIDDAGAVIPLPAEIAVGVDDVARRGGWNKPAAEPFALPTETWREHVARRQRCLELRGKLAAGEIHDANDLITWNLDIRQFAQDAIEGCEGPDLLWAFWTSLKGMSVLDPTCGSGAFLFAALNILEPLYDACLERMQALVDDQSRAGKKTDSKTFAEFRKTLAAVAAHPNRRYFTLKSIVVANLYGVDIMEEAVEICKLRLFLKLVAQLERADQIEPLPDIDFNIRAGNTLVGYTSIEAVRESHRARFPGLPVPEEINKLEAQARSFAENYATFCRRQTNGADGESRSADLAAAKSVLRRLQGELSGRLDRYLAGDYGIEADEEKNVAKFKKWRESHQPFHWGSEFFGIMERGGFDVVIGNPPYLEQAKLKGQYEVRLCRTRKCRDIYAWCIERATCLSTTGGKLGMIVPVSIVSSENFAPLRDVVTAEGSILWVSHFANRPGQLFSGAQNRLTIVLRAATARGSLVLSSRYHRWDARNGERDGLLARVCYTALPAAIRGFHGLLPKVGTTHATNAIESMLSRLTVNDFLMQRSNFPIHWVRVPGYFCQFFLRPPMARPESGGLPQLRGEVNTMFCRDEQTRRMLHAMLNSSSWYQFYCAFSDGRHINPSDVKDAPFELERVTAKSRGKLVKLSEELDEAMQRHTSQWRKSGLLIDSVDSARTKPVIDEIDAVLSDVYGFSDEQLDFIINYDIKYRMGQDETDKEDE